MIVLEQGKTPGVGRIEGQEMMAEGVVVMEMVSVVEMTVMWGVEMVTGGEEVGVTIEAVIGVGTGQVTGLHAGKIVTERTGVAMATDMMTETVVGARRSQKRKWMKRALNWSVDDSNSSLASTVAHNNVHHSTMNQMETYYLICIASNGRC